MFKRIPASESVLPFTTMKGVPIGHVTQHDDGEYVSVLFSVRGHRFNWYAWHVTEPKLSKFDTRVEFVIDNAALEAASHAVRPLDGVKSGSTMHYSTSTSERIFAHLRDPKNWRSHAHLTRSVLAFNHRVAHRAIRAMRAAGLVVTPTGHAEFRVSVR